MDGPDPAPSMALTSASFGAPLDLAHHSGAGMPTVVFTFLPASKSFDVGVLYASDSRYFVRGKVYKAAIVNPPGAASSGPALSSSLPSSLGVAHFPRLRHRAGYFTPPSVLEALINLGCASLDGLTRAGVASSLAAFFAPSEMCEEHIPAAATAPLPVSSGPASVLIVSQHALGGTCLSRLELRPVTETSTYVWEGATSGLEVVPPLSLEPHSGLSSSLSGASFDALVTDVVTRLIGTELSPEEPLMEAGLDSIMAVQLRHVLEAELDVRLPATLTFDYPNLKSLSHFLTSAVLNAGKGSTRRGLGELIGKSAELQHAPRYPPQSLSVEVRGYSRRVAGHVSAEPANVDRITIARAEWDILTIGDHLRHSAMDDLTCPFMGLVRGIDAFDAQAFRISSSEAVVMDAQQRNLLHDAFEALLASNADDDKWKQSTGVFVGISAVDYNVLCARLPPSPYGSSGGAPSVACGRVSYFFGLNGPALSIDTGALLVASYTNYCETGQGHLFRPTLNSHASFQVQHERQKPTHLYLFVPLASQPAAHPWSAPVWACRTSAAEAPRRFAVASCSIWTPVCPLTTCRRA